MKWLLKMQTVEINGAAIIGWVAAGLYGTVYLLKSVITEIIYFLK